MKDFKQEVLWTLSEFIILNYNNTYKFEFIQIIMVRQIELDERVMEFISADSDGISVDWQGLVNLRRKLFLENDGSRSWQPLFENLLDYLVETGTLTLSLENSWTLTDRVSDLSPKKPAPHPHLYFARLEDAIAYRDAFYSNTALKVDIRRARETV
jgi:hypothetical protein